MTRNGNFQSHKNLLKGSADLQTTTHEVFSIHPVTVHVRQYMVIKIKLLKRRNNHFFTNALANILIYCPENWLPVPEMDPPTHPKGFSSGTCCQGNITNSCHFTNKKPGPVDGRETDVFFGRPSRRLAI